MTLDFSSRSRTSNPLFEKPSGRRDRDLGKRFRESWAEGTSPVGVAHIELRCQATSQWVTIAPKARLKPQAVLPREAAKFNARSSRRQFYSLLTVAKILWNPASSIVPNSRCRRHFRRNRRIPGNGCQDLDSPTVLLSTDIIGSGHGDGRWR